MYFGLNYADTQSIQVKRMFHARLAILAVVGVLAVPRITLCQTKNPSAGTASPTPVYEELPASLTLQSLEEIALAQNPTLVQAGAQVRISRGKALQAGLLPNPSIGYVSEQMGAEGTAGELQGMFAEQEIVTGRKLQLSRAKFMQEARQAELQVMAQQYRVLYSVRIAYYNTLARQVRLELRRQLRDNSEEATKTVAELANVGQANRSDLLQAEVALQRAKANLQMAESRYRGAWEELTAVVGMPDAPPTSSLTGKLDFETHKPLERTAALTDLLTCSPQILVAQAEVVRDRIAVQRERVEPTPNLNVRAETGYNFETDNTVAGFELGVRLPLFDRNQGTLMQARAELTRAEAEVARIELMLRQRFARTYAEYESSVALASSYQAEVLPKAKEAYDLYLDSFQKRRAGWPQVVDAQREYFDLYEDYLDNVLSARRAEAGLATYLLEDGLSQPPTPEPEGHRESTPKPR
jgi:cobalt-zinc-cadmium efflux system outer membrane protein